MTAGPAIAGVEGRLAFVITVPETWYELDVHPATREESIRLLVDQRCRGNDAMWAARPGIRKALEEQARAAWEAGAVYCAGFADPTEDGPITGSVMVSLVHDPRAADDTVDWLKESFRDVPRRGDDELAPYAETSVVDLPGVGPCPRTSGIEDAPLGEGHFVRGVTMLTAVPVPDHERVFLVAASSPVLPLVEPLLDLFDAVTGTFRVVRRDADDA